MKRVPAFKTDKEAAAFLEQDLSDLDFKQFKPASFEFQGKDTQLNMRVPGALLDAIKKRAETQKMPYTRYIRHLMERDIGAASTSGRKAPAK